VSPKWTARAVVDALRVAYGVAGSLLVTDEWSFLTEVPLRAPTAAQVARGDTRLDRWASNTRTIDVFLVRNWSSKPGHRRIAVEVKVSRSDYRNETDAKRHPAEVAAHQTYYAAPAGIIDPATLPPGWGLLEVYADERSYAAGKGWEVGGFGNGALVKCRVRPTERTPTCDLDYLVAAGMRRASRAEERIRRGEDDAAKVPALEADVERLANQLQRRDDALTKARDQVKRLRSVTLALEGSQECADCGLPVGYRTKDFAWVHKDAAAEVDCYNARAEVDRVRREAEVGARYFRGWPGPVEPKALRAQAEDLPDPAHYR
jgi:hypothetical protein